jgi:hypothetical protein
MIYNEPRTANGLAQIAAESEIACFSNTETLVAKPAASGSC